MNGASLLSRACCEKIIVKAPKLPGRGGERLFSFNGFLIELHTPIMARLILVGTGEGGIPNTCEFVSWNDGRWRDLQTHGCAGKRP
jgi:hypothetical protein